MGDSIHEETLITLVGSNYPDFVIWDLVSQAFDAYQRPDFSRRRFQTSLWEHGYSTACILLLMVAVEAYRNRMFYLAEEDVQSPKQRKGHDRRNSPVAEDICRLFNQQEPAFPTALLTSLLTEMFVARDVIAHNHIYQVTTVHDDWSMVSHRQKLLRGYGFDAKWRSCVNTRSKRTRELRLNVQPAKIGFEDVFKSLMVFDVLVGVSRRVMGPGYIPFTVHCELGDKYARNLSEILTHYLHRIPNRRAKVQISELAEMMREHFGEFSPTRPTWDCFVSNTCPKCSALGFLRNATRGECSKCGSRIWATAEWQS